ncbi:MAG: dihydroorotase, partial [Bdellovibrionales bacterium]|nr:dihydroorotase [Bdellovibrionales bacterium]
VLITDGRVAGVDSPGSFSAVNDAEIVDASGLLVTPGLVDIHVHLREPGFEWKETVATGGQAAVAGGFTTVCCMPNTKPINDTASVTEFILEAAARANTARVFPIGAITKGSKGEVLAPMDELRTAGCVAFSDDGWPVANAGVMRKALEYSLLVGAKLTVHEEEPTLSKGFSMNESALSVRLGLQGMPGAAEDVMISRDIELSRLTGAPLHFCHVSTARAVTLIRRAKEDGIPVTAEVAPHHLLLTERAVEGYNTAAKMSMPLRSEADCEALIEGLSAGVIDCVASDHAPHELDSKNVEFDKASFGILGLQTTLPLILGLVRRGALTLPRAVEVLTSAPASCLGLEQGTLRVGVPADVTLIDIERRQTLTKQVIRSKSKNTPFLGAELCGLAVRTYVGGREVYRFHEEERSNA